MKHKKSASRTASEWKSDNELFALIRRELYTPVVGDTLDGLGRFHQVLPAQIQAVREGMSVVGRAMPALIVDVHGEQKKPYGVMTESLDDLRPGEVYVVGGGAWRCAYWGEILTATARVRGAAGAVVHGYLRDTPTVLEQNWPVFCCGRFAQDSGVRMQVTDFRCGIEIGGVEVMPGDLIFGDADGVVVVPRAMEAETITKSLEKARGEKVVRKAIEGGMSATAAFKKFGLL